MGKEKVCNFVAASYITKYNNNITMGIKKIFLTGLFFAMALVGWAQNAELPEYDEDNNVYKIKNAAQLKLLNNILGDDELKDIYAEEGFEFVADAGFEFEQKEYDLAEGNYIWRSNIELGGNVYGNGATIKFKSEDLENGGGYATGLFVGVSNEYESITIEGLNIEATIENNEPQDIPVIGLLICQQYLTNHLTIKSVNVKGTIEPSWENTIAGGLLGYVSADDNASLTIQDCKSEVEIKGAFQAGGIIGSIYGGTTKIKNCISEGIITSENIAGGIVGSYFYEKPEDLGKENKLDITSCANTGTLTVTGREDINEVYMGGIVGNYYNEVEEVPAVPSGLIIDYCSNTGILNPVINEKVIAHIGSLVGRDEDGKMMPVVTNSYVCYGMNAIIVKQTYPYVSHFDDENYSTVYDNVEGAFMPQNGTFVVETEEDFDKMLLAVMAYNAMGIQPKVEIKGDFDFRDISYEKIEREGEIENNIGRDSMGSIGSSVAPFEGNLNADGAKFYNYAVKQNSLMGVVGKNGVVEGISIPNAIVIDNLSNSVEDADGTKYAAVFANKNSGVISYCSYVGVVSVPNGMEEVIPCLVGENEGEVSYSFLYVTNLDEVKAITSGVLGENKAAIIVKGNTGVAKKAGGKQKKIAVNNNANKLLALNLDAYFTPEEAELNKEERGFSNEEFASGVVAYWLNYAEAGYTGEYTCRYSQGEYTPELQSEAQAASDGGAAVHKIVYDVPEGTSISSGAKPFANGGEEVVITLSQPVKSASVTTGDGNKSATTATLSADGKTITFTVPKTKKPVVMLSASNNATALTRVEPNSEAKIVVIDGKVKVFGAQGETVVVYGINGAVLHSEVLTSDKVDLPAVPHGIYFVKVGGATKKISL